MANLKKTILITGGAGFIGKNLCKYLQKKGYNIRIMLNANRFQQDPVNDKKEIVFGDITDLKTLIKVTRNIYAVVNLAARKSDEKDSFQVNVIGVQNLLKACEKNKVKKFIQLSTVSAKISKKGIYGETKELADQIIVKGKIPYVILRVSLIYANKTEGIFASLIKASRLPVVPIFGDGNWISSPIHIDDLSQTIEKAIISDKLKNQIWDVGGPDFVKFDDLIRKIAATQNKKPLIIHIPAAIGLLIARVCSLVFKKPPITVSNILGSTQNVNLDLNKYFKDYQIQPIALDKGLKQALQKDNNILRREVEVITKYILSAANTKYQPEPLLIESYSKIELLKSGNLKENFSELIISYPYLLGPVDVLLRLFYPDSILLKKIYALTALLECNPVTSNWLLPIERNRMNLISDISFISAKITFKYIAALFIAPFFIFYARNQK